MCSLFLFLRNKFSSQPYVDFSLYHLLFREAGKLIADLHLSFLSSKSNPPVSLPALQQSTYCNFPSFHFSSLPIDLPLLPSLLQLTTLSHSLNPTGTPWDPQATWAREGGVGQPEIFISPSIPPSPVPQSHLQICRILPNPLLILCPCFHGTRQDLVEDSFFLPSVKPLTLCILPNHHS